MTRPRLLLVPSFTELEWGILSDLKEWAELAAFDMPGTGEEPLPEGLRLDDDARGIEHDDLMAWREAGAARGASEGRAARVGELRAGDR